MYGLPGRCFFTVQRNHQLIALKSVICAQNRSFYAMGLQATVIRDILYTATSYGAAYDTLREMAGFTQEEISDSALNVEWQKAANIWDMLADLTGNEQVGLTIGEEVNMTLTGMVGFLMQSSQNLEEAMEVYCRYGYMICPMITFVYRVENDKAIVEMHQNAMWKTAMPRSARIAMDFSLACMVNYVKLLTGKDIYPLGVELEFARTGVAEYTQALHTSVLFNAPLHRAIFHARDMQTPVITSDRSLYDMFNNILAQKKSLALQVSCSDTVKNLLLMQFKGQIPTIEEVAAALNMTVRTLQRKLTEERASFRAIANDVKKELALHLMKNPDASITDVAGVMGYGDLPAFRRAFKTWTKATPKEVKQKLKKEFAVAAVL